MQQRFGHDSASALPRRPKPYAVSVQVAKLTDRLAKLEGKFESLSKSAVVEGSRTWISAVEEEDAHAFIEAGAAAPARRAPASLFSPEFPSAVPPGSLCMSCDGSRIMVEAEHCEGQSGAEEWGAQDEGSTDAVESASTQDKLSIDDLQPLRANANDDVSSFLSHSPNSKGQLQGPRKLILGTGSSRERLFAEAMAVLARQQTQALEALRVEAQAREKQQSSSIAASREQDAGLADQEAQLTCPENQRSTTQISQSASPQACKEFSSEHIVRSRLKGA